MLNCTRFALASKASSQLLQQKSQVFLNLNFSSFCPKSQIFSKNVAAVSLKPGDGQQLQQRRAYGDEKGEKLIGERKLWVGGGVHLNIREDGKGDHIVLCLPGICGTHETDFQKIIDGMNKNKFHVICWDPPGYGKSRPNRRFDIGDYYKRDATLSRQLMDRLGYKHFSLLGWGTGGTTALNFATHYPERVTNVVMWGAHAFYNKEILQRLNDWMDIKNWQDKLPIYGEEYLLQMLKGYKDSVAHYVKKKKDQRLVECCKKTTCPTLVFHGGKDHLVDADQIQYFADNIPNSKVHKIPDAGYDLHLTHTKEFIEQVEKLILASPPGFPPKPESEETKN